jgi:hypothetical protein
MEFPERWTAARLAQLMPNSTPRWWLDTAIPLLTRAGVIRKVGRSYIGCRSEIRAALLSDTVSA